MERRNKNLVGLLQLLEKPTKYLSKSSGLFILPEVLDLLQEAMQIHATVDCSRVQPQVGKFTFLTGKVNNILRM
jgi:hypothetical protein